MPEGKALFAGVAGFRGAGFRGAGMPGCRSG